MTTDPSGRPPLDAGAVAAALAGTRWRPEVLAASPSTNAVAAERLRRGEPEGLVVVADHQTAGRGRLDRTWVTPAGAALTFSVLLTPEQAPVARWPWLPLLAGVAVAEGVRRVVGLDVVLKWPNDVLAGDRPSTGSGHRPSTGSGHRPSTGSGHRPSTGSGHRKVCGILVERVEVEGRHRAGAVVGVGVNVAQTADELPVPTATSLAAAAGAPVDRVALLAGVLDALATRYDAWRRAGGDATRGLHAAYTGLCDTIGRTVRVQLPNGDDVTGEATGIDADGRLLIRTAHGVTVLGAGDVVHVRPAAGPA